MMNTRLGRLTLLAVAFAFVLAPLLFAQTVQAQGYAFTPPPGWTVLRKPGHGMGIWVHPDHEPFHQNINVVAQRYRGSLDVYTAGGVDSIKSMFPNVQMGHVQRATVCGSHPASYLTYAATVHGRLIIYEQMATLWNGVAYIATYARLSTQPSLPAARTALTSLCGGLPPVGGQTLRSGVPQAYASPSPAPTGNYATPAPVGSVAPTITPRP